jgi:SapC protein
MWRCSAALGNLRAPNPGKGTLMELPTPPGYTGLVPLDREKHGGLGVDPSARSAFVRRLGASYLTLPEFQHAARDYPIAFAKDGISGELIPVAVLGLTGDENLFLDESGDWEPHRYVPAYVRRWPFFAVDFRAEDSDETRSLICVDESVLVESEQPLMAPEGGSSEAWAKTEKLISDMQAARTHNTGLAQTLERLDLVVPFEAHAQAKSGQQFRLRGLFRVDEPRLQELSANELKKLVKRGELPRIYAHLMSLDNFRFLLDRATAAQQTAAEG